MTMDMLESMKKLEDAMNDAGVVQVNNIIEGSSLEYVKGVLKKFGYKFFVENRAYKEAGDIGDARRCLYIHNNHGVYRAVAVTFEAR